MNDKVEAIWADMVSEFDKAADDKSLRYCPICYCAVPRSTYHSVHMPAHGYEVLDITPSEVSGTNPAP